MSTSAVRKPAPRLPQPASRYWQGKAPKGAVDVQSDSDDDDDDEEQPIRDDGDVPVSGDQDIEAEEEEMSFRTVEQKTLKTMNVTLRDVNISKEGKVIIAGREESGRTLEEEEGRFFTVAKSYHCLTHRRKNQKKRKVKKKKVP